ncbi:MAG: CBS domain-containing protein [Ectothiorhodospiraceae bacterium]|nr:CBS domain-containing protein [Ectothiorhodospiraceae bacterium]
MTERTIIRVSEVMKKDFDMVDGLMSVSEAVSTMKHVDTKCVLVDKRHANDVFGMVLISDVAREVLAKDRAPERVNVYEIMTKPVMTVPPDLDIRYCARLFERFGLSRAPVEENGKIVGVVSLTDMVLKGLCASL